MGGKPLETMALIGARLSARFSMSAASIGPVKAMLRALDVAKLHERLDWMLADARRRSEPAPATGGARAETQGPV